MATRTEAALLPKLREISETRHIFVLCFLQNTISAELLQAEYEKKGFPKSGAYKNDTPACHALFNAYIALRDEANRCAKELICRGELLFAWTGTTALEGGAA